LWEIFSYGKEPWAGRSNDSLNKLVKSGDEKLSKPDGCPDDVYALMLKVYFLIFQSIVISFYSDLINISVGNFYLLTDQNLFKFVIAQYYYLLIIDLKPQNNKLVNT